MVTLEFDAGILTELFAASKFPVLFIFQPVKVYPVLLGATAVVKFASELAEPLAGATPSAPLRL
jgi:hypothetical protein